MTNDLQRDIEAVDDWIAVTAGVRSNGYAAWQRLKPRLTPDRERVKAHLRGRFERVLPHLSELAWADIADTAIKAMGGSRE